MVHICKTAALSLSITLLASCTVVNTGIHSKSAASYPDTNEVPIATNFATNNQYKLQAAEHWKRAAYDAADSIVAALQKGAGCIPKQRDCVTLYIKQPCEQRGCMPVHCETMFGRVFHDELVTALVSHGYPVSAASTASAVTVDIGVQTVSFRPDRPQYRYAGQPVRLGPGIWALRDVDSLVGPDGIEAARTVDYSTNWYRTEFAAGETPQNEIVVTVSATAPQRTYLARSTRIYYTSDADAANYSCSSAPPTAPMHATGAPTYTVPVVGDCSGGRCIDSGDGRSGR